MACPEPEGLMEQETMFLQFLGNSRRFDIANGQAQIFCPITKRWHFFR